MDGRRRLAEAFGRWADAAQLSQADIAARGGPSTTTQTKVRTTDGPISRQTLRQIDHVTGWPPGTAGRLLQGAPVSAVTLRPQAPVHTVPASALAKELASKVDDLEDLVREWAGPAEHYQRRLWDLIDYGDESQNPDVVALMKRLWRIDMAESTRALTDAEKAEHDEVLYLLERHMREATEPPRPQSVAELKRRRLLADAMPVEEAAYEGDLE